MIPETFATAVLPEASVPMKFPAIVILVMPAYVLIASPPVSCPGSGLVGSGCLETLRLPVRGRRCCSYRR